MTNNPNSHNEIEDRTNRDFSISLAKLDYQARTSSIVSDYADYIRISFPTLGEGRVNELVSGAKSFLTYVFTEINTEDTITLLRLDPNFCLKSYHDSLVKTGKFTRHAAERISSLLSRFVPWAKSAELIDKSSKVISPVTDESRQSILNKRPPRRSSPAKLTVVNSKEQHFLERITALFKPNLPENMPISFQMLLQAFSFSQAGQAMLRMQNMSPVEIDNCNLGQEFKEQLRLANSAVLFLQFLALEQGHSAVNCSDLKTILSDARKTVLFDFQDYLETQLSSRSERIARDVRTSFIPWLEEAGVITKSKNNSIKLSANFSLFIPPLSDEVASFANMDQNNAKRFQYLLREVIKYLYEYKLGERYSGFKANTDFIISNEAAAIKKVKAELENTRKHNEIGSSENIEPLVYGSAIECILFDPNSMDNFALYFKPRIKRKHESLQVRAVSPYYGAVRNLLVYAYANGYATVHPNMIRNTLATGLSGERRWTSKYPKLQELMEQFHRNS